MANTYKDLKLTTDSTPLKDVFAMEAFCMGEPWNAQLVNQQAGYTALVTGK